MASKRYISRADKRELGIPVNIWDAARSLNEHRVLAGEEPRKLRAIIKEPEFRRQWNVWRDMGPGEETARQRNARLRNRVQAGEYFGWFVQDSDGTWRYVG